MPVVIGIDHGYYAIKTPHICFPTGLAKYDYEPYTMQRVLQYAGHFYVCGTGRQTLMKDKTANDNYYLLTMAALAQELQYRKAGRKEEIILAAGLPLASFGREKTAFRAYLFRKEQPLRFRYENEAYELMIKEVKLFPQGYSALILHPEILQGEPSVLLVDIEGWTVDLMRLDNAVPNAATCRSLEQGVIRCIDETLEQVRRGTGLSLTDIQIERVLNGSTCSIQEYLYEQLAADGMLQIESWNEAEEYLISKGIYDITLIEEKDFREYKGILMQRKGYTKQRAIQGSAALRKIQKYWIEKEFGELLEEIREYDVPEPKSKGNIQSFLIRQKIHHIQEVDYLVREKYEKELRKTRNYSITLRYLNVFDHLKQLDIQKEMGNFASRARNRIKFRNQIIFLPYLTDQELAKEFDYTQDKNELVWDFTKAAPEQLKRQVFELLNYILENLYRDDPKERRVRYLLPLLWLYDFCKFS